MGGYYDYNKYYLGDPMYFSNTGNLTLICDIKILKIVDQPKLPSLSEKLANTFSESNINPSTSNFEFTDVVLCIGNDKIHCHKMVLAMSSKVFEKMLQSDMKESKEKEIVLKEIELDTLKS